MTMLLSVSVKRDGVDMCFVRKCVYVRFSFFNTSLNYYKGKYLFSFYILKEGSEGLKIENIDLKSLVLLSLGEVVLSWRVSWIKVD